MNTNEPNMESEDKNPEPSVGDYDALCGMLILSCVIPSLYYQVIRNHVLIGIPIWTLSIFPRICLDIIRSDERHEKMSKTQEFGALSFFWMLSLASISMGYLCDQIPSSPWISFVYQVLFLSIICVGFYFLMEKCCGKPTPDKTTVKECCRKQTPICKECEKELWQSFVSDPLSGITVTPIFAACAVLVWWALDSSEIKDLRLGLIAFIAFLGLLICVVCCQTKGYGPDSAIYILAMATILICLGSVTPDITSDPWERCLYHMLFAQIFLISVESLRIYCLFPKERAGEWTELDQVDLEQGCSSEVVEDMKDDRAPTANDTKSDTASPPPYMAME